MLIILLAVLSQDPPAAAPKPAEPAPAPAANDQPAAAPAIIPQRTLHNADEIARELKRIQGLPPEEAAEAMKELQKRMPTEEEHPRRPQQIVKPPDVRDYATLPEIDQARYSAREFFNELIAGDARAIVSNCGFPFQLEDRKLYSPEEAFQEWLRNLRAKRTDLLTLYDIEILSPADMEKKYGRPPSRLANLPWKHDKTYVAVANLSGHAAIAVLHQQGLAWAVVGYAD
jgi:hypothetical protein